MQPDEDNEEGGSWVPLPGANAGANAMKALSSCACTAMDYLSQALLARLLALAPQQGSCRGPAKTLPEVARQIFWLKKT